MKIAIIGTAPSSMSMAPLGDRSWKIFACSPGTYPTLSHCDAFFELHRWEPGEIGQPATQKPWFSPEYVAWMGKVPLVVWMANPVPEIPRSKALPVNDLLAKYGSYFFTSSIAWMLACAIEDILEDREIHGPGYIAANPDVIGLYGIDMAANEEYGYQRAGCQHFIELAATLGIQIYVPPESDLLRPMPLYGIDESSWWMIKLTARQRELTTRLTMAQNAQAQAARDVDFLMGALDDMDYHIKTWGGDRDGTCVNLNILAKSPALREIIAGDIAMAKEVIGPLFGADTDPFAEGRKILADEIITDLHGQEAAPPGFEEAGEFTQEAFDRLHPPKKHIATSSPVPMY